MLFMRNNGKLNLYPRHKPAVKNRNQTYSLFEDSKDKKDSTTPRKLRDMAIDKIGQCRTKRAYKSQPRRQKQGIRTYQQSNISPIGNLFTINKDIEFNVLKSKRQERLKKLHDFFKNPDAQAKNTNVTLNNKSLSNINVSKAAKTIRNRLNKQTFASQNLSKGAKEGDANESLMAKPYLNHTSQMVPRSKSVIDKQFFQRENTGKYSEIKQSRNKDITDIKRSVNPTKTSLIISKEGLLGKSIEPEHRGIPAVYSLSKLAPKNNMVSKTDIMMNQIYSMNRKAMDIQNRRTLLG